jgi:hypothetical protein
MRHRLTQIIQNWRTFAASPLGARLLPLYAALAGAAVGALVANQIVRSMWSHAIFTGYYQWRTAALVLTVLWVLIGAVAAVAALGPAPGDDAAGDEAAGDAA